MFLKGTSSVSHTFEPCILCSVLHKDKLMQQNSEPLQRTSHQCQSKLRPQPVRVPVLFQSIASRSADPIPDLQVTELSHLHPPSLWTSANIFRGNRRARRTFIKSTLFRLSFMLMNGYLRIQYSINLYLKSKCDFLVHNSQDLIVLIWNSLDHEKSMLQSIMESSGWRREVEKNKRYSRCQKRKFVLEVEQVITFWQNMKKTKLLKK